MIVEINYLRIEYMKTINKMSSWHLKMKSDFVQEVDLGFYLYGHKKTPAHKLFVPTSTQLNKLSYVISETVVLYNHLLIYYEKY
jgi:hypothetical protein